ncbi:MAG: hypothetical protein FK731_04295, partial [Asgard group archaeon]|nr:hypothetical protein [Asgard group archaeon]
MDILHTIWDTNSLHLWMESRSFPLNTTRSITRPIIYPYHRHPYSLSFTKILSLLKNAGFDNLNDKTI